MRKTVAILTILLAVMLVLTGCDSSDYKKAINLYNNGKFDEAIAILVELGDYSDSNAVLTDCYMKKCDISIKEHDYSSAVALLRECETIAQDSAEISSAFYSLVLDYVQYKGSMLSSKMVDEDIGIAVTAKNSNGWIAYIAVDNDTHNLRVGSMCDEIIFNAVYFVLTDSSDIVRVGRTFVTPFGGAYDIEMGATTTTKDKVCASSTFTYTDYAGVSKDINGRETKHKGIQDAYFLKDEKPNTPIMQWFEKGLCQLLKEIDNTLTPGDLGLVGIK